MKRQSSKMRVLREELRYYQTMYRVDLLSLRLCKEKIKEIAFHMRKELEKSKK